MILLIKGEQKAVTRCILTIALKGVNKFKFLAATGAFWGGTRGDVTNTLDEGYNSCSSNTASVVTNSRTMSVRLKARAPALAGTAVSNPN